MLADKRLRILVGANGGVTSADEGKLPASPVGGGAKRVAVSLSGLAGGHAGNDIGFKRMNTMKALTAILQKA